MRLASRVLSLVVSRLRQSCLHQLGAFSKIRAMRETEQYVPVRAQATQLALPQEVRALDSRGTCPSNSAPPGRRQLLPFVPPINARDCDMLSRIQASHLCFHRTFLPSPAKSALGITPPALQPVCSFQRVAIHNRLVFDLPRYRRTVEVLFAASLVAVLHSLASHKNTPRAAAMRP